MAESEINPRIANRLSISTQPVSATKKIGDTATFSTLGNTMISTSIYYQWMYDTLDGKFSSNSTVITDNENITGATTNTLTIKNITEDSFGCYRCRVYAQQTTPTELYTNTVTLENADGKVTGGSTMGQQFKFNIITGENAQTKYDAIATKEPFTFYLLQTGVGYLGEKKLFDGSSLGGSSEVTLTGKFFRAVASHVITQEDLDNTNLSKPEGTVVGDAGILFTADNNNTDDGDESKYFVPIKIPTTISEIDGTNPGNDIPTATAVVNYINKVLGNYVTFEIDGVAGTVANDGDMIFPGAYSTNEVRIGTWTDGKPLYRMVVSGKTPDVGDKGSTAVTVSPNLDVKNLCPITKLGGTTGIGNFYSPPNTVSSSSATYLFSTYTATTGAINIVVSNQLVNLDIEIVLEYTKLTV